MDKDWNRDKRAVEISWQPTRLVDLEATIDSIRDFVHTGHEIGHISKLSCSRSTHKASFIDLTTHRASRRVVARAYTRSLSRSAARAHVREPIHLTGNLISRYMSYSCVKNFRRLYEISVAKSAWFTHLTFESSLIKFYINHSSPWNKLVKIVKFTSSSNFMCF